MSDYYSLSVSEAIKLLNSSEEGLSKEDAKKRLNDYGYNELKRKKSITAFDIFLSQFRNTFILLLIFAGMLSLFLGENIEASAILVIVIINAAFGFVQEYKAEKAMEALEKISTPTANVIRDGNEEKIPAKELVIGDIVLLEEGDIVTADSRLMQVSGLHINEASLTGESLPSRKTTEPFKKGTSVADQENMAFMGTIVTYGKGKGIVTAAGMKTELGKIAASIQTTKETKTPLQIKFEQLAKQIAIVAVGLIAIVLIFGVMQGALSFGKMLLFALALTVSTIPNSLPIIVTISLSLGAKRLAKKNMLIKKLPAAESLGATTIICSDKTGTITKNQMTATHIYTWDKVIEVGGTGYCPEGNFYIDGKEINPKGLELLLRIGYLCNNAKLVEKDANFEIIGDPTEGSLIVLGKKGKLDEEALKRRFSLVEELPFDSDRKRMTTVYKNSANKKNEAYVKGAPDILLKKCNKLIKNGKIKKLTVKDRGTILKANNLFAEQALRVLGLAYSELSFNKYTIDAVEKNLIFVGLVGMIDPPREEAKKAIEQCHEAGIKVIMITGDHAITATAVAKQIGLFNQGDIVLTGDEIEKMSDAELEAKIDSVRITARALPIQKSRIVDALQKRGHVVAMTGDGVNDAPALKKADIGIAMGITGTDVAKEVSKATLVDDNFATIVNAIEEGRSIYDKMIKSAKYLLSCNTGEITCVFLAILLKLPIPLLPLQLLLMNLLTDDFPALGLGSEPTEEGAMKRPPRNPKENPLSAKILLSILAFGLIMGIGTLLMFIYYNKASLSKARTVAFTTLVMFQMFAVISSRTLHHSWRSLNPFSNKILLGTISVSILLQVAVIYFAPLGAVFGTVPLTLQDWLKIIGVSSLGFIVMELSKIFIHLIPEYNL